jgi:hypothetical protein
MKAATRILLLAGLFATMPVTVSAWAQGTPEQRKACKDDAYKWCPYDVPDPKKTEGCLRKNIKWITADCQAQFGYKAKN